MSISTLTEKQKAAAKAKIVKARQKRDLQIGKLMAKKSVKEIATTVGCSPTTVRTVISKIQSSTAA